MLLNKLGVPDIRHPAWTLQSWATSHCTATCSLPMPSAWWRNTKTLHSDITLSSISIQNLVQKSVQNPVQSPPARFCTNLRMKVMVTAKTCYELNPYCVCVLKLEPTYVYETMCLHSGKFWFMKNSKLSHVYHGICLPQQLSCVQVAYL